jgi:hypothetical protein
MEAVPCGHLVPNKYIKTPIQIHPPATKCHQDQKERHPKSMTKKIKRPNRLGVKGTTLRGLRLP